MAKKSILSACCAIALLTGCDHYSNKLAQMDTAPSDVQALSPAAGGDMSFGQHLANEYYHLARYEQDKMYDYRAAKRYTRKMEQISQGQLVGPSPIEEFKIEEEKRADLAIAREQLLDALQSYNIPENRYNLAMAQSRFDCWLDQAEENPENVTTCRNEFNHAMASLVPPDGSMMVFQVPFDAESMVLSEEARISIGRALSLWRVNNSQSGGLTLTPAMGVSADVAERQISMVRSILQFNGVPPSAINVGEPSEEASAFEIKYQGTEVEEQPQA